MYTPLCTLHIIEGGNLCGSSCINEMRMVSGINLACAIFSYKLVYKYVDLKVFSSQIVLCICSKTFLIKTMITTILEQ